MFLFNNLNIEPETVSQYINEFEQFCIGETQMSPTKFKNLNIELSINAVLKIGRYRYKRMATGRHLIWIGKDGREHDLGPIDSLNIMRDYPGFHKLRTLSLGHHEVAEHKVIEIPFSRKKVNFVRMNDGAVGLGLDYKTALRNAALKSHLKKEFNQHFSDDLWRRYYGHA